MLDPTAWVAKWAERTGSTSAQNAYKAGVQRVTESPALTASRKLDKYAQGVADALASGKTKANMAASPLSLYQDNAINVGAARIPSGVKKGTPKVQSFVAAFAPFLAAQQAANAQMDDTTLEARIAKSADMQRRLAGFRRPAVNTYS